MPYNPLDRTIRRFISVLIFWQDVQVVDANTGKLVESQVLTSRPFNDNCDYDGICGYPNVTCNLFFFFF
jgi:hypothetical protein